MAPRVERPSFSKLSVKSQTVIPNEVRRHLGLKPGDVVSYRIVETGVMIEKAAFLPADDPFAEFDEWSAAADEKAFAEF